MDLLVGLLVLPYIMALVVGFVWVLSKVLDS
jgi:hypothetical protein